MKPYFSKNGVRIYHGDCRDILPLIKISSSNAIVTDPQFFLPPPGHNTKGDNEWCGSMGDLAMFESAYAWFFKEFKRLTGTTGQVYVCCHDRSYPSFYRLAFPLWPKVSAIVWYKPTGRVGRGWRRSYELVLHASGKDTVYQDGFRLDVVGIMPVRTMKRGHPAQKPGELGEFLMEALSKQSRVIDPFMGSGTFIVEACKLGHTAIGIEIEERYCELAAARLRLL